MAATEISFPTVSRIAERFGVSVHQVLHIIRSRGIKPLGRAGMANIYSAADVTRIGDELRDIAGRRTPHASGPSTSAATV